jgi:hypothetical protein
MVEKRWKRIGVGETSVTVPTLVRTQFIDSSDLSYSLA